MQDEANDKKIEDNVEDGKTVAPKLDTSDKENDAPSIKTGDKRIKFIMSGFSDKERNRLIQFSSLEQGCGVAVGRRIE